MKELLEKVLAAYGPSGHEDKVRAVIEGLIRPYVDELRTDALGNLIARKHGAGKRIMLAAHMDQIGFIVTGVDKHGFLRVHNVGGIYRRNSLNRRVVFENGMSGVVSCEVEGDSPTDTTMLKLFIDIGAADRADALSQVALGDMAVYAPECTHLMNRCVCAPAMDNRAGCALLIGALQAVTNCPNEVVAVFTSQEEVGLRGARAAAYDVDPDVGIALDVTLVGDTPKGERLPMKIGGGIAIKVMDSSVICAGEVVAALEAAAEGAGAAHQREILFGGGTDAGAIHQTRSGVPSGALSIPSRYVHSACEVISLDDLEAGVKTLAAFLMRG